MADRELSEINQSGELDYINLGENVRYVKAANPEAEGMFLRVGTNGMTELYRAVDQDVVWVDTDTTSFPVTTSEQVLLAVAPDMDVLATDGSFSLGFSADNTTNQERTITISVQNDGVEVDSDTVVLGKDILGKPVLYSGQVGATIASGSVISVVLSCSGTGVNIRGDAITSKFTLTKANANPVLFDAAGVNDIPAVIKAAEVMTGFDREDADVGGKTLGNLEYCHSASGGVVHFITPDGTYTELTGQTTFADGTGLVDRMLYQSPCSGESEFSYWRHGELISKTSGQGIQLATDFKGYIGYNEDGDLDDTISDARELIVRTPLVAYLYLNSTKGTVEWFADERHGIVMSGQTHIQQHLSTKFFYVGGLEISGLVNNGEVFTAITDGACGDEDIKMVIPEHTTYPKLYMEGSAEEWTITDDDNKLGVFVGGDCCYNYLNGGSPELVRINSDYVVMTIVATNNKLHPIVAIVGQTLHANRGDARDHAPGEYFRIKSEGLPSPEMKPLYSMIIHDETDGQIETGANGEIYMTCKDDFPYGIF